MSQDKKKSSGAAALRSLPSVERLVTSADLDEARQWLGRGWITETARRVVQEEREHRGRGGSPRDPAELASTVLARCRSLRFGGIRRVVNATGVVLHTNLGRACIDRELALEAVEAARGAVSVELDLATGERGNRYESVQRLLGALTGCEASVVVNNNAAAVLLVVNTLALGKEVVVSRGELIEIGGSFRLPEILVGSGAVLREVGTTNRTHLADFRKAIGPSTGLLMKTHTSNYRVEGFTKTVSARELMALSAETGVPVYEDLGSGSLADLGRYGLTPEPTVQQVVASGIPLVSFSGDKLLGGPQAGIIVGTRALVGRLMENHLLRALRTDKLTMALLERTLAQYLDPKGPSALIPTHQLLARTPEELRGLAQQVLAGGRLERLDAHLLQDRAAVGGGACPTDTLPTWTITLAHDGSGADDLAARFRARETPVIGRVKDGKFCLDMRTVRADDVGELSSALGAVDRELGGAG
ncbi:MAG: L-seryl-tRNA(Sec) selenium transferase [Candidatus Wallbacteria bacterium]|nr:L-seryl-tRNA(Sec) selenium transferase [Candidatus Wallbacteria bacterium]